MVEDADDRLARCLRLLGRDPATLASRRRLSSGGSGAGVHHVVFAGGDDAVVKVTTGPAREHARRELLFYRSLAGRVPVRTPRLIAGTDTDELTGLLLTTARPSAPPAVWSVERWLEVAADLGALHRPSVVESADDAAWAEESRPDDRRLRRACAAWARLGRGQLVRRLLERVDELEAVLRLPPICLLHGDCHAANLLEDADRRPIWVDWQAARRGHGPEDLALLWQRAEADGGRPPRAEMLEAYAEARGLDADESLRRALVAAEARSILVDWPHHLPSLAPAGRDRILRRLGELANEVESWR